MVERDDDERGLTMESELLSFVAAGRGEGEAEDEESCDEKLVVGVPTSVAWTRTAVLPLSLMESGFGEMEPDGVGETVLE